MINVRLKGELGNVLFQYALGKHLAIKNSTKVRFNTRDYLKTKHLNAGKVIRQLSFFNIDPSVYRMSFGEKIYSIFGTGRSRQIDEDSIEKGWGFDPYFLSLKKNITLYGYFQSEKYFKDIEDIIRNDLQFNNIFAGGDIDILRQQIEDHNSVSIHVRRGDYLNSDLHFNLCNTNYFMNSINYIKKNVNSPKFIVFSDDLDWCKQNLSIPECVFVDLKISNEFPVVDMHLMSLCKHNIISNSTFSWWAAWLNKNKAKIILSPKMWFTNELNKLAMKDTIPEEWIKI